MRWDDLTDGTFIQGRRNLIIFCPDGTGKKNLVIAVGMRACEFEMTVKLYRVAELVMKLTEGKRSGALERLMTYIHEASFSCWMSGVHTGRQRRFVTSRSVLL